MTAPCTCRKGEPSIEGGYFDRHAHDCPARDVVPELVGPMPWRSLCELAWGLVCNAGEGDWTREHAEWQKAAVAFRETYFTAIDAKPADAIAAAVAGGPMPGAGTALALLADSLTTDLELLRDLRLAFEPDEGMSTSFEIEHYAMCPGRPINGTRRGRECICGLDETIRRIHDTEEALHRLHAELRRIAKAVQS